MFDLNAAEHQGSRFVLHVEGVDVIAEAGADIVIFLKQPGGDFHVFRVGDLDVGAGAFDQCDFMAERGDEGGVVGGLEVVGGFVGLFQESEAEGLRCLQRPETVAADGFAGGFS
jgi:hypothetical protein